MKIEKQTNPDVEVEKVEVNEARELSSNFILQFEEQVDTLVAKIGEILGKYDSPGYEARWTEICEVMHIALGSKNVNDVIKQKIDTQFGSGFYDHMGIGK